ncbi:putative secreted protein [Pseudonocardia sp. N23]|nr:putative secreted protein [Pseudonocardia sp. N23]
MASVAIVGAAAAAVVSLSSGPSTAENASADLDLAHQAGPPPVPGTPTTQHQPTTQTPPTTPATQGNGPTASDRGGSGTGTSTRTTTTRPATARAVPVVGAAGTSGAAAQAALQQVGKPYKWGSTGPSAFDCSGLVFYAFQQIGVTLPRTAAAMSQVGTPVTKAQLEPGDLVFFYSPISHVAIYIGDGEVVNATTDGEPVQVSLLSDFPMTSARRV